MVAKRSGHWAILSLMVMLASTPRTEMPPPRLPGADSLTAPSGTCSCGGEFEDAGDGILFCQKCGDPPPDPTLPSASQ